MSNRPEPIDRFTAEQMLRGESAGADHAPDRLADLLGAAAAPGRDGELTGEKAAMTAFREARLAPEPQLRRLSMIKATLAQYLTLKAGAVALTVTATTAGGVALASGTGNLPGPLGGSKPTAHPTHLRHSATPGIGKPQVPGAEHHTALPAQALTGLCRAFQAGAGKGGKAGDKASDKARRTVNDHARQATGKVPSTGKPLDAGKALDNPAFSQLVKAAGGKDKVAAFCAELLKQHPGKPKPSVTPKVPAKVPTKVPAVPTKGAHVPSTLPTKVPAPKPGTPDRTRR